MPDYNVMALSAAIEGTATAGSRGCDVPKSLRAADQLIVELRRLAGPQPEPPLPSVFGLTADKLRTVLLTAAKERGERESLRAMAEAYIGPAVADYIAEYRTAWPTWLPLLAEEFDKLIAEFSEAAATAPASIESWTSDEQVAAYMRASRAASALERLVADRSQLGASIAEDGHGKGSLLLVAAVPLLPTDVEAFAAAWPAVHDTYHGYAKLPAGLDRWKALLASPFTPSLALAGDIARRWADYDRWDHLNGELHSFGGAGKFNDAVSGRTPLQPRRRAA